MRNIASTNGLAPLWLLTGILLKGTVGGSNRCEVKDIHVTSDEANATFVYKLIYKNSSCSNKGEQEMRLESCNGINDIMNYGPEYEGISLACAEKGRWKVTVPQGLGGHIESTCFNCTMGMYVNPAISWDFNSQGLKITMREVNPRVITWNFTVYKTTRARHYLRCNDDNSEKMKQRFYKTDLQPYINRTYIAMSHDFEEACYCFLMQPIGSIRLHPPYIPLSTNDCKPIPIIPKNGRSSIDDLPMSFQTRVTMIVLLITVTLAGTVFYSILYSPQVLGRLLGLKRLKVAHQTQSKEQLRSRGADIFLLHAPDVSGNENLNKLKKSLQDAFKVHDLYDRTDYQRLADPCGWVEMMLMSGSGVKLLLVESVGLTDLINSLLNPHPENPDMVKATQTSSSLLIFALRTIIGTDLRENYSTVFVVRFSDEVEDVADLVVQMRRYKFPDHFLELKEALSEARCSTEGKDVI